MDRKRERGEVVKVEKHLERGLDMFIQVSITFVFGDNMDL